MAELKDTLIRAERAFLVGVQTDTVSKPEAESLMRELGGLANSLGLDVAGSMQVRVRERNAALFLGSGKADEIVAAAKAEEADSIVFDHALTPVQQRNWEKLADLKVYDRSELIIKIFASRALTKEASLQVELAQLPVFPASPGPLLRGPFAPARWPLWHQGLGRAEDRARPPRDRETHTRHRGGAQGRAEEP